MSVETQGRRVHDDVSPFELQPGEYMKRRTTNGKESWEMWYVRAPDGSAPFFLANEHQRDSNGKAHEVEEHEDGTITVQPRPNNSNSILSPSGWHGYIYRGVWRSL